jgi:succinate dehydrogenase / fumarate reductase membrane anchor subunit
MSDFQNPGARSIKDWKKAEGHGTLDWLKERYSSLALVPLFAWALISGALLAGEGADATLAYFQKPENLSLGGLTLILGLWHTHMGLQVIIDDYFPQGRSRGVFVFLNTILILSCLGVGLWGLTLIARSVTNL